ncbi:MAG: hypothetical protein JW863_08120 [Chitinispirillaceae bacterium]|nr:hypothetical protein [Chitinispirillaceae bacterium]
MQKSFRGTGIVTLLAILLSTASIIVELTTGICTEIFFDPIPTLLTTLLACTVPLSLVVALYLLNAPFTEVHDRIALVCTGVAFSVSAAFSLQMLPTMHFCAIGLIVFGIGSLGLSPYLCLTASLLLVFQWHWYGAPSDDDDDGPVRRVRRRKRGRWIWLGIPAVAVILFWCPMVIGVVQWMLHSDTVSIKNSGLSLFRYGVSREAVEAVLHRNGSGVGRGIWYTPTGAGRERLMEAYHYLYGTSETGRRKAERGTALFFSDRNIGGDRIGEPVPGLDLCESAIDVAISENEGTACTEWTMTFENHGSRQAETRAYIRLPSYGVVSDAALWIDGKESPAVFGRTEQVKRAYRKVVSVRRDPLLVTWVAPEVVRVQCFPVLPDSTMKIRIRITAPLLHGVYAQFPSIQYCNFEIPGQLHHAVKATGDGIVTLHGADMKPLRQHFLAVGVKDVLLREPSLLLQCEDRIPPALPPMKRNGEDRPVLVIDGVVSAAAFSNDPGMISRCFSKVYCANPYDCSVWEGNEPFARFITAHARYRTVNATIALKAAIADAQKRDVALVWAYGETSGDKLTELAGILRRFTTVPVIGYALDYNARGFPFGSEICRFLTDAPVTGVFHRDITDAVGRVTAAMKTGCKDTSQFPAGGREESCSRLPVGKAQPEAPLYDLLVYSQVMEAWYKGKKLSETLVERAVAARLVTPASGAVVLENRQQYEDSGLNADGGEQSAVSVDEPEMLLLMVLGLCILSIVRMLSDRLRRSKLLR